MQSSGNTEFTPALHPNVLCPPSEPSTVSLPTALPRPQRFADTCQGLCLAPCTVCSNKRKG